MIVPNLHQGSRPPPGRHARDAGFDVVVLTAKTYQPAAELFPGVQVLRCPMDDQETGASLAAVDARACAKVVAELVKRGNNVLVTCEEGRNRSGLVAGLSLVYLGAIPARAVMAVRERRRAPTGPALSNSAFVKEIMVTRPPTPLRKSPREKVRR